MNLELQRAIRSLPGYDPFAQAGDCYFDEDAAQFAIDFIQTFCHFSKGTKDGQPLTKQLFKLEFWEKAIVANIFGWKKPDGTRRYKEALLFVPRKNGKSELAAAIIVFVMFSSAGLLEGAIPDPGAEIYGAAAKRDQTKYIFDPVKKMILAEPWLKKHAQVFQHAIVVGDASYKKVSSEATTEHGGSTSFAVIDELHAQPTRDLVDVLQTSTANREQAFLLHVTTSDFEREGSICNIKYDYACKVRDGVIDDPSFLPIIYEADQDADWTDEEVWKKANPNYGVSVRPEYLKRECETAREDPSYENTFKRLHLNIRTEAFNRWITSDKWDACGDSSISLDDFAGVPCFAGIDLASTQDFNAFVPVFKRDGVFYVFPFFWVPEETAIKREREKRIPYSIWARDGWLTLTDGDVSDPDRMHADINDIVGRYKLKITEIPVDRMFQGMDLIRRLVADGLTAFAHGQGSLGMIPPTKTAKDAILGGYLKHNGSPVLRWMMSNVVVHPGEGKEYPMRDKSADKIDGVVAMIMGVGRADLQVVKGKSYYDEHDFEM
jgi:phage terminase large subunit-like protein